MKKISIILALAFLSTACTGRNHTFDWTKPVSLNTNAPDGPYNYRKGWEDGCETGLASNNTRLHLFIGSHKFTLDKQLRHDNLYSKAWNYGYNHCGFSMKALAQYSL